MGNWIDSKYKESQFTNIRNPLLEPVLVGKLKYMMDKLMEAQSG